MPRLSLLPEGTRERVLHPLVDAPKEVEIIREESLEAEARGVLAIERSGEGVVDYLSS